MEVIKDKGLIEKGITFRNRMNGTNCSVEDIMKIYIGTPVSDYLYNDAKMGGFVPHKKKINRRNYFI